jgi:GH43 family beta-xylosidase
MMYSAKKSFLSIWAFLGISLMLIHGYASSPPDGYFANPILAAGPDPYVHLHTDGYYYTMVTVGDRLKIWKSKSFTDLADAESKVVWNKPDTGPNSCCIWAPELHFIDNAWYIYYTATDGSNPVDASRYVFVMRNENADPLSDGWEDLGRINTAKPGIDGQVFEYKGQRYFVYSPYVGHQSGLSIAKMSSPWTIMQPETLLGLPIYDWEKTPPREIMEGPQFLEGPEDKIVYNLFGWCMLG